MGNLDPISLEILWTRLIAIADEAAVTLVRSSFSPVVRESNDFSCVLFDSNGHAVSENTIGIPSFNDVITRTIRHFLDVFPKESWKKGDVGITNDPWMASGHLPDVTIITPIFRNNTIVGWSGSVAHKSDMGGALWSADTKEVYEEGLRIVPIKLFEAGQINETLIKLIETNIRLPEQVIGDIMAQVSAGEVAGNRLLEVMDDEKLDSIDDVAMEIQNRAESAMRESIRNIPDGVYSDVIETDGIEGVPIRIQVEITVKGDEMIVDYEGSSSQVRAGLNVPFTYTRAYTCYPIKCVLDPLTPRNEGSYRPVHVKAPKGSIMNASFPAPVHVRQLTGHYLTSAIYGALSKVLPNRVIADSGSTPNLRAILSGMNDEGENYTAIFFLNGGMGARPDKDGLSCVSFPSNTSAGSMETIEASAPLRIWKRELRCDSGGPGRCRGGLGQDLHLELIAKRPATLSLFVDRMQHPARGVFGGHPGSPSEILINGSKEGFPVKGRSLIQPGDKLIVKFPGGGGYGNPSERSRDLVKLDVLNELVSTKAAKEIFNLIEVTSNG